MTQFSISTFSTTNSLPCSFFRQMPSSIAFIEQFLIFTFLLEMSKPSLLAFAMA